MAKKKPETVLVLRTCNADMTSHGGFRWPESGPVEAPDWSPVAECGNGLHGWLWGNGDSSLASTDPKRKGLVVRVLRDDVIDLAGKVKFPRGVVEFCGDLREAATYLRDRAPAELAGSVMWAASTSGDYGTSTSGYRGTSTSGEYGTSTSGYGGTLVIKWWDGRRYRLAVAYVGENGIKPNTPYRLNDKGDFVEEAND